MSNRLVGIYTITPLHCGTGQAVGAIDQPIARERHTGHPLIPAPSIKGRLREIAFREAADNEEKKEQAKLVFGPDTDKGEKHAGAAVFTDARLIAFPVRSLQAVFYWVTCPMILRRCRRDVEAAQIPFELRPPAAEIPNDKKARLSGPGSGLLVLEDLAYEGTAEVSWNDEAVRKWAEWLQKLIPATEPNRARIADYLVILSDEDFTDLVTRTTPVAARILLDNKTKTTSKGGNLWYEETVPPDSLFYCLLCPKDARGTQAMSAAEIITYIKRPPVSPVQIGGNETVGQGWCHWQWVEVQA